MYRLRGNLVAIHIFGYFCWDFLGEKISIFGWLPPFGFHWSHVRFLLRPPMISPNPTLLDQKIDSQKWCRKLKETPRPSKTPSFWSKHVSRQVPAEALTNGSEQLEEAGSDFGDGSNWTWGSADFSHLVYVFKHPTIGRSNFDPYHHTIYVVMMLCLKTKVGHRQYWYRNWATEDTEARVATTYILYLHREKMDPTSHKLDWNNAKRKQHFIEPAVST